MSSRKPPSTRSPSRTAIGWSTIPVRRRASRTGAKRTFSSFGHQVAVIATVTLLSIASARCGRAGPDASNRQPSLLRIGVGQIDVDTFLENFTLEGLTSVGENGRVKPWLAKDIKVADDGRSIVLTLRPGVRFHDSSLVPGQLIVDVLRKSLAQFSGPAYSDVESITATSDDAVEIKLKQPSQFVMESLDALVSKPGAPNVGTGPFVASASGETTMMRANENYYLGQPAIDRIELKQYTSPRAAWADMLRDSVDMVYEVGLDELDSLQAATTVNVFSSLRHYQYIIIFNLRTEPLHSATVRRSLNIAIDREALIRDAMGGHGVASSGPVWPRHWAAQPNLPAFTYDPSAAASTFRHASAGTGPQLRFTCLVAPDSERVALVVKRQLEAVGVEMVLKEVSHDEFIKAAADGRFDAIISSVISGPSLVRPYLWWDSHGPRNRGGYSSANVDSALESIRHAITDDQYRSAVLQFQNAILADPPAIFLAWDEHARAVSSRFDVATQPGTDIIRTLHLWRPVAGAAHADKN